MTKKATNAEVEEAKPDCIIIMPISAYDDCGTEHCEEVLGLLKEAITNAGFTPKPAWENASRDVIHKKIIENLYNAPLAICDVSGQNPNVMFELGMRLAFDKPTLIIKDDATDFCFDIGGLHHETYPRNLRISSTRSFMETVTSLLKEKYAASQNPEFSSFLKTLGPFQAEIPETVQVPPATVAYSEIQKISADLQELKNSFGVNIFKGLMNQGPNDFCLIGVSEGGTNDLVKIANSIPGVKRFSLKSHGSHKHGSVTFIENANQEVVRRKIRDEIKLQKDLDSL